MNAVAGEQLAHFLDQPVFFHRELRLGLLLEIILALGRRACDLSPNDQVLDQHLAPRLLVRALDYRAWASAPVGVLHLLAKAMLRIAEIKFGAYAGVAQGRNQLLIIGD